MCWHKWSKWKQYEINGRQQTWFGSKEMVPFTERRQKRYCLKCNKEQDRLIPK